MKFFKWLFPYPIFSTLFCIFWLFLTRFSVAQMFIGLGFSIFSGYLLTSLRVKRLDARHLYLFFKLFAHLLYDMLVSHIKTLKMIFYRQEAEPGLFITLPLKLRNKNALALLSCLMALTPGAIWVSYNSEKNRLLMHLLDKRECEDFKENFYTQYEHILWRIFEEGRDTQPFIAQKGEKE